MTKPGLERPDGYSEEEWEAYQEGAQKMLELAGSFLLSMAGDVGGDGSGDRDHPTPPSAETADAGVGSKTDAGEDDDDHPENCPDCGMELVYEIGTETGDCPNCDLLD